jgi:hypothetical protein
MNHSKDTPMPRPKQEHSNNAHRWLASPKIKVKDESPITKLANHSENIQRSLIKFG